MFKQAFIDLLMYFRLSAPRYTTEGRANRHKEENVCLIAGQRLKLYGLVALGTFRLQ